MAENAATTASGEVRDTAPRPPRLPADSGSHVWLTLAALAVAGMVVSVQQTLVIPLLPLLMKIFDASVTSVTWVFTASLLAGAVATPLLSRFGDMYGKKKMILTTMGLLIAGSVICALSSSLGVLLAGRALQGTSASLIPLAIGMIRDTFPREKVTTAIGVVSATMGAGGTLGMIVTGLIADHARSHRPVFWVAAGLAAAGGVLVLVSARDVGTRVGGRPDFVGAALLAAWLICLLLGISEGNTWGWTSGGVLGLYGAAVVLCVVWLLAQRTIAAPLVRMRLLVGSKSLSANLVSLLLGFSLFAAFTLVSTFIQTPHGAGYGLGGSVLDVGLYTLPSTVTMLVCASYAGRMTAALGAAFTTAIGAAFAGLSALWLALSGGGEVSDFLIFSAIQGVGFGVAYAALGTLAVQHVPMDQSGIASGVNSLVRTTGGSVGSATTAALLAGNVLPHTSIPSLHGYVLCYVILAIGAWVGAVVAVVHGIRHRDTHPPHAARPAARRNTRRAARRAANAVIQS